jgi:hypothetical protein
MGACVEHLTANVSRHGLRVRGRRRRHLSAARRLAHSRSE